MSYFVFVYGTLRIGQGNHDLISKRYLSVQQVEVNGFKIEIINKLPFALASANSHIMGELFEFDDPQVIKDLDVLEGYQIPGYEENLYNRDIININGQDAFIYTMGNPNL
jgi:gamma-glutamylcyclotransferase (GGCT)/AIG2-like uncharacterized protein YtfP